MAKILITEDDTFLKGLIVTKLSKEGFEVFSAGDGKEAMAILEKEKLDLMILDIILPGEIDGIGILKKIRETPTTSKTPVIMFSNMSDNENVGQATKFGATAFMVKSNFTLDELVDKIKELLKK